MVISFCHPFVGGFFMGLEKKAPKRGGSEGVGYSTLEKNKSNSSLVSSLLRYGLNKLI